MDPQAAIKLRDGNTMPVIGFGTAGLEGEAAITATREALEVGYRLIDTAAQYSNESDVGEAIRTSDIDREEIFITTKIPPESKGYVGRAVKERCELLGVEYLDLCLLHWPPKTGAGGGLWQELIEAKRAGFCKSIGVSNYSYRKAAQLYDLSGELPVVNQIEASPFGFDRQFLLDSERADMAIQAYSPLTRGNLLQDDTLKTIAKQHEKKVPQVLLRWSIQKGMVPLPRSKEKSHIHENYDVFDFKLSDKDMDALDALNEHYKASA